MVQVILKTDRVVFEVLGADKIWAFKSRLEIPFSCIRGANADPDAGRGWWKGWRLPGTQLPGVITAGTYYKKGKRTFWDVHGGARAIVVDLVNHKYDQLVIEVEDPIGEVRKLEKIVALENELVTAKGR